MKTRLAIVRAPNNFYWKITKRKNEYDHTNVVTVSLVNKKNNRAIGTVSLYEQDSGVYETHSLLDHKYHGRGLGTKLYAKAIQWCLKNGIKVRSSGCTSEEAQRVWRGKGIRKYYKIVTERYKWSDNTYADSSMDVFHAYKKPNKRK